MFDNDIKLFEVDGHEEYDKYERKPRKVDLYSYAKDFEELCKDKQSFGEWVTLLIDNAIYAATKYNTTKVTFTKWDVDGKGEVVFRFELMEELDNGGL